jgi:hypothetical protein
MREQRKGHPQIIQIGSRKAAEARGLHWSGKQIVSIRLASQLESLSPEKAVIVLEGGLGWKKRDPLMRIVLEKGFKLLHISNPIERIEAFQNERKARAKAKESKKIPDKKIKQPAQQEKPKEKTEPAEAAEDLEKKEQDKLLTKRA